MKAIVFFEGKEVCQLEYDRVAEFAGQLDFFMEKELIAYFAKGHSYLIIPNKQLSAEQLHCNFILAEITAELESNNIRKWWKL